MANNSPTKIDQFKLRNYVIRRVARLLIVLSNRLYTIDTSDMVLSLFTRDYPDGKPSIKVNHEGIGRSGFSVRV